ncbi:CHAT domain-containing protein [Shimia abyssi]|uniref:CHAT domain-containing protein n=1 Tax=Shimia abyssi TaxID=1662395 RepID=A0A2P8FBX5_9RHOB|nr:CHAT domain-containing protein [Shimia abyssi]PSL19194.1 CHAT domain-containing protein [Shimia abyssi]
MLCRMVLCLSCAVTLVGLACQSDASSSPERATLLDEAFQAAQWGFTSSAGSALHQTSQRLATGDDALARRLQDRQLLADKVTAAEATLARLGGDDAGSARAEFIRISGEIGQLNRQIEALDTELSQDFPAFDRLARPTQMSISNAQSHLDPDEALLFVYTGDWDTFVWLVTKERAVWHRISVGSRQMDEAVTAIRQSLHAASTVRAAEAMDDDFDGPATPAFDRGTAWLLYRELIAPVESHLDGVRHVYTVADGALSSLPFSLLVTDRYLVGEDDDPVALRRTSWLFRHFALTTLPTVESLALVTQDRPKADGDQLAFLGFGDPVFSGALSNTSGGQFFRSGSADLDSIRALAPLPNTRREIHLLADVLGRERSAIHLGADANEATLRSAPTGTADVIAFATHGLLSGDLTGLAEPALVLTPPEAVAPGNDGLLTSSEISAMSFSANWVVLSACNTAGGDGQPDAEGLSGLARAFLFAGARSLLVSHWPVRDDAAAQLTTDMFTALSTAPGERRKSEALRRAMQTLLMDESDPTLAHPAAWAPFVVVGHGGY